MRSSRVAYGILDLIRQNSILPDPGNYETLLRQCGEAKDLSLGRCLHAHLVENGFDKHTFFFNHVVQMYGKCQAKADALQTFSCLQHKDVYSWTFMIGAYAQLGWCKDALAIFQEMQKSTVSPNSHTFIYILSACRSKGALFEGRLVHTIIIISGFEQEETVTTSLICMYGNCSSNMDALQVFYKSLNKDTISWNVALSVLPKCGSELGPLNLFQQMQVEGFLPSKVTVINYLDACSEHPVLPRIKRIHSLAVSCEYDLDAAVSNAFVTMYGKCMSITDARTTFQRNPVQNIISWTALISAYAECGKSQEVVQLLRKMAFKGFTPDKITFATSLSSCSNEASLPDGHWLHCAACHGGFDTDEMVGTALIGMYGKCRRVEGALRIFEKLPMKDVVCWNAMIAVYAQHGHGKESLELLRKMGVADLVPSKVTFISILDACADETALHEGRLLHACLMQFEFESETVVGSALVNLYGKCGALADCSSLFWKLPEKSVSSWTAIIAACGQQGWAREAFNLCQQMREDGVVPNEITFISILSSCSHAGMVEEAWDIMFVMEQECSMTATLEHFDCFLDLLGRAGLLGCMQAIIDNMPFHPGGNTWMAFLGSCKLHNYCCQAERVALQSLEVDSGAAAPYVLLSNICIVVNDLDDLEEEFMNVNTGEEQFKEPRDSILASAV